MADFSIEGAPWSQTEAMRGNGIWGPYWLSESLGAIIYINTTGDVVAKKTTDGGITWGSAVVAEDVDECLALSCWFDRQTPGDTGTVIHVAYTNDIGEDHIYNAFDINAGTWGTPVVVNSVYQPSGVQSSNNTFITKTRSGNIIIGATAPNGSCHKASSPYTSWTSIANPSESNANDQTLGCSVNTGDGDDAGVIFWDISANQISIKVYDNSANSWTETLITSTDHAENTDYKQMSCTTRLSDGHVLLVAWNAFNLSTADMTAWDINPTTVSSVSVTQKTNVVDNSAASVAASIFVDQVTNDVYVVYIRGGTIGTTASIYYRRSTDGMATWSSEFQYSEGTADDYRILGYSAMSAGAGKFLPAWFDDDDLEIYIDLIRSVRITTPGDFPVSSDPIETLFASSVTSMPVNLPGGIHSGDLLLAFVEVRNAGTWPTIPTGWVELTGQAGGGAVGELTAFYKIADGTEGTTATWVASTGTTGVWHTRKISNWHGTTPPEWATTSGDATTADPPSLSPSWGSDDNLWFAIAGHAAAVTNAFTAAPSGYSDFLNSGASSGGSAVSIATSTKEATASSEDPGTFTVSNNRFWAAATLAVRPVGAAPSTNVKSIAGVLQASVKEVANVTNANLKKISGVENVI